MLRIKAPQTLGSISLSMAFSFERDFLETRLYHQKLQNTWQPSVVGRVRLCFSSAQDHATWILTLGLGLGSKGLPTLSPKCIAGVQHGIIKFMNVLSVPSSHKPHYVKPNIGGPLQVPSYIRLDVSNGNKVVVLGT